MTYYTKTNGKLTKLSAKTIEGAKAEAWALAVEQRAVFASEGRTIYVTDCQIWVG